MLRPFLINTSQKLVLILVKEACSLIRGNLAASFAFEQKWFAIKRLTFTSIGIHNVSQKPEAVASFGIHCGQLVDWRASERVVVHRVQVDREVLVLSLIILQGKNMKERLITKKKTDKLICRYEVGWWVGTEVGNILMSN